MGNRFIDLVEANRQRDMERYRSRTRRIVAFTVLGTAVLVGKMLNDQRKIEIEFNEEITTS